MRWQNRQNIKTINGYSEEIWSVINIKEYEKYWDSNSLTKKQQHRPMRRQTKIKHDD